ncbi:MAG: hypothetical protein ACFFD7_12140 [Candidatus Thorarchaeota archaeon]
MNRELKFSLFSVLLLLFISSNISINPLGIKNTHYQDDNQEIITNRAFCYVPDGKSGYLNFLVTHDQQSSTDICEVSD